MFKKNREVLLSDNQILKSNQMDVIANIYEKKKKDLSRRSQNLQLIYQLK